MTIGLWIIDPAAPKRAQEDVAERRVGSRALIRLFPKAMCLGRRLVSA